MTGAATAASDQPEEGYDYDAFTDDLAGLLDQLDLRVVPEGGLAESDMQGMEQGATDDRAVVDCIGAFGRTDFRADLAAIKVPTLVLHGDSDATVPFEVSGRRTADAVAGADLVVIEGGPHGCNVSHADEFNAALLKFIDS